MSIWDNPEYTEGKTINAILALAPDIDRDKLIEILEHFKEIVEDDTQRTIYWSI